MKKTSVQKREYASEHHNWDMTMRASSDLLTIGELSKGVSYRFSAFTGSMLLSISALESFLNSFASFFEKGDSFSWEEYERKSIEDKLEFCFQRYSLEIKKGERPFQTVKKAISWRNSLIHYKPIYVDPVVIASDYDIKKLPQRSISNKKSKPYENLVDRKFAKQFNNDIIMIIQGLIKVSGINPRAQCSYKVLDQSF
ncbi:MAG: hypothetical protein H6755_06435 [Candidatus Omnitrophica bacterium]|nr:hypothetical protein [Candidatus Omnitrophota bacterium]